MGGKMKKLLREKILSIRNQLTKTEVEELSTKIIDNIKSMFDLCKYQVLAFYLPLGNEVDLRPLIQELLDNGKTIVLPKTLDKHTMAFYPIKDLNDYHIGRFKVMEPNSNEKMPKDAIEIMFIPGIAFSHKGYRLGFGAGYYDRYLVDYPNIKVGVCYDFQVVEELPTDLYDIPVDVIITETPRPLYRDED